jgi:hypothetical protein
LNISGLSDNQQSLRAYVGDKRANAIPQEVYAGLFHSECSVRSIARKRMQSGKKQILVQNSKNSSADYLGRKSEVLNANNLQSSFLHEVPQGPIRIKPEVLPQSDAAHEPIPGQRNSSQ